MRVLLAGSSGLIGTALASTLRSHGVDVARLVRDEARHDDEFSWDPEGFGVPDEALDGVDGVVSLGGVGVGDRAWSGRYRQELRDSRITPTHVLAEAVAQSDVPVFLSASATGFYGDTGDREATEADGPGAGFLADLTVDWEAATEPAAASTRVALLRTAPVFSPHGGMLGKLRPAVKAGLGGRMGSGQQFLSWISLRDEVAAIEFLLNNEIAGPVNLSAPIPVRFNEFIRTYGRVLHRPTVLGVPAMALRLIGGDMAQGMTPGSSRVVPDVLTRAGFEFTDETLVECPDVDALMADSLRRSTAPIEVRWLGTVDYRRAYDEQHALAADRASGELDHDVLLLLEHPSTYTAGKRTEQSDLPTDGSEVITVDRGGRITWHGPGQLVGYPIVALSEPLDVVEYVRRLEQALIDVCAAVGVTAGRVDGRSGVWLDDGARKIAQIGIRVAKGVALHGFALNVDPDLGAFDAIVPCGIADVGVTSLAREVGRSLTVDDVRDDATAAIAHWLDHPLITVGAEPESPVSQGSS